MSASERHHKIVDFAAMVLENNINDFKEVNSEKIYEVVPEYRIKNKIIDLVLLEDSKPICMVQAGNHFDIGYLYARYKNSAKIIHIPYDVDDNGFTIIYQPTELSSVVLNAEIKRLMNIKEYLIKEIMVLNNRMLLLKIDNYSNGWKKIWDPTINTIPKYVTEIRREGGI